MNDRIKELRTMLGLSAEKFGARVGVTRSAISRIENGVVNVTEQMIKSVCREFNVNEEWLRTGEGEMCELPDNTKAAIIADMLGKHRNSPYYEKLFRAAEFYYSGSEETQMVLDSVALAEMTKNKSEKK